MKLADLSKPIALAKIIAESNSNNISVNATGTSYASQTEGFPAITMIPEDNGGEAPHGLDFNGFLKLLSSHVFNIQNGSPETFNTAVSSAIGGYPKNAQLWLINDNNSRLLKSTKDDNTDNFLTTPSVIGTSWVDAFPTKDYVDNNFVHLTGDETIGGAKTFTSNVTQASTSPRLNLKDTDIERGSVPSAKNVMAIDFQDTNGNYLGYVQSVYNTNKAVYTQIGARKSINSSDTEVANIVVGYYSTGIAYSECPTPTDTTSTSSKQIANVGWANSTNNNIVHKTGNETIGGTKTFSSTIHGSINGNAATVTNGVYTTGNQTIGGTKTFSAVAYGKASAAAGSVLTTVQVISNSKGQAIVLGNGFIVQWGKASDSGGTVQLPTPFSNTNYSVVFTRTLANGTNDNDAITSLATNSFSLTIYQGGGGQWIAVGK